ncbi:hypothetical protein Tco_0023986, partial [Tanacetum coccineum]
EGEEECSWTGKGVFGIGGDDGCVLEAGDCEGEFRTVCVFFPLWHSVEVCMSMRFDVGFHDVGKRIKDVYLECHRVVFVELMFRALADGVVVAGVSGKMISDHKADAVLTKLSEQYNGLNVVLCIMIVVSGVLIVLIGVSGSHGGG